MLKSTAKESFEQGWVEDWQGNRGILKTKASEAWFFVRAYNMEPEAWELPVRAGEEVAFQWVHEGSRMIVTRCVRRRYSSLPAEWAAELWPPQVGSWAPISLIGKGGNGEVWRAASGAGAEVAVKYLKRRTVEGYKRFRAEVAIMQKLKGVAGILPIIDSGLPPSPSGEAPPWFAMPLAQPLRESPATTSLESLVEAFSQIAATLAELAQRGIAHRDIKPDNLFWFDNRSAVGDFGLVAFPGKEALTAPGRKLGPMYYIAPEMLNDPDSADGRPADVYSLAKTLWVMATGQTYPPPGEQRDSVYQMRLSTYVIHRKARYLDKLISSCTRHDPESRPDMAAVAEELKSWSKQRQPIAPPRPRRFSKRELARVGVQITDPQGIVMHCSRCGQGWSPNLRSGGKLPRGYWKCPNRCNWD